MNKQSIPTLSMFTIIKHTLKEKFIGCFTNGMPYCVGDSKDNYKLKILPQNSSNSKPVQSYGSFKVHKGKNK
jgi:hypothetical protein